MIILNVTTYFISVQGTVLCTEWEATQIMHVIYESRNENYTKKWNKCNCYCFCEGAGLVLFIEWEEIQVIYMSEILSRIIII